MSADGTWQLVIDSPMGKQHVEVALKEEGGALTGTMTNTSNNMTADVFDGSTNGDELAFKAKLKQFNMTLAFATTVQDDTMSGKVKAGMFGSYDVSGQRA
jgi:hypothetical protein